MEGVPIAGGAPHPTGTHLLSMSPVFFSQIQRCQDVRVWAGCWAPVSCGKPIWNFLATPGTVNIECVGHLDMPHTRIPHDGFILGSYTTKAGGEVMYSQICCAEMMQSNHVYTVYIRLSILCWQEFLLVDLDLIPEHSSYPSKQQLTNHPSVKIKKKYRKHAILDACGHRTPADMFLLILRSL